jgi:hypothetical protein
LGKQDAPIGFGFGPSRLRSDEKLENGKMSEATMKARIVRISCEKGKTGLFYATSSDLKGLLVAEATIDALQKAIPAAIRDMYAALGVEVVVSPVDEPDHDDHRTWVALPVAIAREALAKERA